MNHEQLSQCRMAFMKGFMQFLPDNLQEEHAWPAMQAYVKNALSAHGRKPWTLTVMAQDWSTLDEAFIQNLPNIRNAAERRTKIEHAYTFGNLEAEPLFHQFRAEASQRAHDQAERVFERLQMSLFIRHTKLEVGYAFLEYRPSNDFTPPAPLSAAGEYTPNNDFGLPAGLPSLVITQAHAFPKSVAWDLVGTEASINRFVEELKMEGLHARVYN